MEALKKASFVLVSLAAFFFAGSSVFAASVTLGYPATLSNSGMIFGAPLYSNLASSGGYMSEFERLYVYTGSKGTFPITSSFPVGSRSASGMLVTGYDALAGKYNGFTFNLTQTVSKSGSNLLVPSAYQYRNTVTFWAKDNSTGVDPYALMRIDGTNFWTGLSFAHNSTGAQLRGFYAGSYIGGDVNKGLGVFDNTLHFYKVVQNGLNNVSVYRDGSSTPIVSGGLGNGDMPESTTESQMSIGSAYAHTSQSNPYYTREGIAGGEISCLRYFNTVSMGTDQTAALYAEGPDCSDLVTPSDPEPTDPTLPTLNASGSCPLILVSTYSGATYTGVVYSGSVKTAFDNVYQYIAEEESKYGVYAWQAELYGVQDATFSTGSKLSGLIRYGAMLSGVTNSQTSWNPITWGSEMPQLSYANLYGKPNRLVVHTAATGAIEAFNMSNYKMFVRYWTVGTGGVLVPPFTAVAPSVGSLTVGDEVEVRPYSNATATGFSLRYETERPFYSFRLVMPYDVPVNFDLSLSSATYQTVTVSSCSNEAAFGGPMRPGTWDNDVSGKVPEADEPTAGLSWLTKLGWVKDLAAGFAFSVPSSPTYPSILVPIMVPRVGSGNVALDIGFVETDVSDISEHTLLFTPNVYQYGTGGYRKNVASEGPAVVDSNVSIILSLAIAALYIMFRLVCVLICLGLLTLVTTYLYRITDAAFPVVSDTFGKVQVSAGFSGLSGLASVAAFMLLAGVMVPIWLFLGEKSLYLAEFFADAVIPYIDFFMFAVVRNTNADWTTFAQVCNIVGNGLVIAAPLYAVWRAIQFLGKA